MKDSKHHYFEAMHAAADGNMEPAKRLFGPKKIEKELAAESAPLPKNWLAEVEEKQEEAAERFRKSRKATTETP